MLKTSKSRIALAKHVNATLEKSVETQAFLDKGIIIMNRHTHHPPFSNTPPKNTKYEINNYPRTVVAKAVKNEWLRISSVALDSPLQQYTLRHLKIQGVLIILKEMMWFFIMCLAL